MSSLDIDATKICAIRLSKQVFNLLCQRANDIKQDPNFLVYGHVTDLEKTCEDGLPFLTQTFYQALSKEDPMSSLEVKVEALTTSIDVVLRMSSWGELMRRHPKLSDHCQKSVVEAMHGQENLLKEKELEKSKKITETDLFFAMEQQRSFENKKNRFAQIIKAQGVCPVSPQDFFDCTFDIINNHLLPYYQSILEKMNEEAPASSHSGHFVLFREGDDQEKVTGEKSETLSQPSPSNKMSF